MDQQEERRSLRWILLHMGEDSVESMRVRMMQCRRLAGLTHDRSMSDQLRHWADAIEAEIKRLEAERAAGGRGHIAQKKAEAGL